MCNLSSMTGTQQAIIDLVKAILDRTGKRTAIIQARANTQSCMSCTPLLASKAPAAAIRRTSSNRAQMLFEPTLAV